MMLSTFGVVGEIAIDNKNDFIAENIWDLYYFRYHFHHVHKLLYFGHFIPPLFVYYAFHTKIFFTW